MYKGEEVSEMGHKMENCQRNGLAALMFKHLKRVNYVDHYPCPTRTLRFTTKNFKIFSSLAYHYFTGILRYVDTKKAPPPKNHVGG